jgi:hypothetical protein
MTCFLWDQKNRRGSALPVLLVAILIVTVAVIGIAVSSGNGALFNLGPKAAPIKPPPVPTTHTCYYCSGYSCRSIGGIPLQYNCNVIGGYTTLGQCQSDRSTSCGPSGQPGTQGCISWKAASGDCGPAGACSNSTNGYDWRGCMCAFNKNFLPDNGASCGGSPGTQGTGNKGGGSCTSHVSKGSSCGGGVCCQSPDELGNGVSCINGVCKVGDPNHPGQDPCYGGSCEQRASCIRAGSKPSGTGGCPGGTVCCK